MEYRFKIDGAYTPQTLPLERLGDYIAAFAKLLGEKANVHFGGVETGSVVLKAEIDEPAAPKVRARLEQVQAGGGPADALAAFDELDGYLRKDNATGNLSEGGAVILPFPGRDRPEPLVFGPFKEDGTIDGVLIRVGGRDETVPVHLRDGEITHTGLYCTPEIARRIAPQLLGPTLRVHGTGTWVRAGSGAWELQRFKITDFELLDDSPLVEVVSALRKVSGSDWGSLPDPVRELLAERHGDESAH